MVDRRLDSMSFFANGSDHMRRRSDRKGDKCKISVDDKMESVLRAE